MSLTATDLAQPSAAIENEAHLARNCKDVDCKAGAVLTHYEVAGGANLWLVERAGLHHSLCSVLLH